VVWLVTRWLTGWLSASLILSSVGRFRARLAGSVVLFTVYFDTSSRINNCHFTWLLHRLVGWLGGWLAGVSVGWQAS
jgi:predicted GNAT superfamily acetyltransferase